VISGFHHAAYRDRPLLGYYAVSSVDFLPNFGADSLSQNVDKKLPLLATQ
jgi:hypothetical protein